MFYEHLQATTERFPPILDVFSDRLARLLTRNSVKVSTFSAVLAVFGSDHPKSAFWGDIFAFLFCKEVGY